MSYNINNVIEAVKNSKSYAETLRYLNRQVSGGNMKCLKNFISKYGINTDHFVNNKKIGGKATKKHYDEFLIHNEDLKARVDTKILKRCLFDIGRELKCDKCNIKDWFGDKRVFQIDHVDGNWKNNLPNNLRFLCANCHVLTETYSNKKHKVKKIPVYSTKINWPTTQEMYDMIWAKPVVEIAKELNVSDAAIHKFCKKNNINKPPRGYWLREEKS